MELVTHKMLRLYSGRSHPKLAEDIAAHLGVPLGGELVVPALVRVEAGARGQ